MPGLGGRTALVRVLCILAIKFVVFSGFGTRLEIRLESNAFRLVQPVVKMRATHLLQLSVFPLRSLPVNPSSQTRVIDAPSPWGDGVSKTPGFRRASQLSRNQKRILPDAASPVATLCGNGFRRRSSVSGKE